MLFSLWPRKGYLVKKMPVKALAVEMGNRPVYFPVTSFENIRGLIGGFGTRYLTKKMLREKEPFNQFKLILLKQLHSDIIQFYDSPTDQIHEGDALVTTSAGLLLCVQTADCLPVLIVDEVRHIVAAVHCGWRGTVRRILPKVVSFLVESLEADIHELKFAFGPKICGQCYEVGEEVREEFLRNKLSLSAFTSSPDKEGKWKLDLGKANVEQLEEKGIHSSQIEVINHCTFVHSELWSWRRDRKKAARLFNFIGWFP